MSRIRGGTSGPSFLAIEGGAGRVGGSVRTSVAWPGRAGVSDGWDFRTQFRTQLAAESCGIRGRPADSRSSGKPRKSGKSARWGLRADRGGNAHSLTVNQRVAGSSPAPGAKCSKAHPTKGWALLHFHSVAQTRTVILSEHRTRESKDESSIGSRLRGLDSDWYNSRENLLASVSQQKQVDQPNDHRSCADDENANTQFGVLPKK